MRPEVAQRLHEKIIAASGGSKGLREPGMLVAICEKPQATFDGHDLYPTLADKAAALYEALINYYVFIDGNKRTAVVALNYFLTINNHELVVDDSALEAFTLNVATNSPNLAGIAAWIRTHTRKISKK